MQEEALKREIYITDEERKKCRKVVEAYIELYELEDIFIVDAGRYGFVKLMYYTVFNGFESMQTYTDSKMLFDDLWSDWLDYQLYEIVSDTTMTELSCEEIFDSLPEKIQEELIEKRSYFAARAGVEM